MRRYFKLVCLHDDPEWYIQEFQNGRARFGWSGPGMDLRVLEQKQQRSDDERITWSYTKFLLDRIRPGDRVVVQVEQPLQRFLIGEVILPGYEFSPGNLEDFNHMLHVQVLTPKPIPVNSRAVTAALKHDLAKRGQYYEIYPQESVCELDDLVQGIATQTIDFQTVRTDVDTMDHTAKDAKRRMAQEISRKWPAQHFERFCELLCGEIDNVEVKERADRGKGWDLLLRIINPITQKILLDDVPVQCKNFTGPVESFQPIDDLERAIRNSSAQVAYLFILGQLSGRFKLELERRRESLQQELGRLVSFELVDEDRIAELYACLLVRNFTKSQGIK